MVHNLFRDYCLGLGNGPFWTLGLEEQLYVLYAVYLALRRRLPQAAIVIAVGAVSLSWQFSCRYAMGPGDWTTNQPTLGPAPFELGRWLQWPFGLWLSWIMGAVAAEGYTGAIRLPSWCRSYVVALTAAGLGFVFAPGNLWRGRLVAAVPVSLQRFADTLTGFSDPCFAAAAFVLITRWAVDERAGWFRGPWITVISCLGLISYSLYLTHAPVLIAMDACLTFPPTLSGTMVRYVVSVPMCLAFAGGFFWLVERRFLSHPAMKPIRSSR